MNYLRFVIDNQRFLVFGFALAFFSSFGQTFFIGVFGEAIRDDFGLDEARYGAIYSAATLVSGLCMIGLGRQIDRIDLRHYSVFVCLGLVAATLAISWAGTWLMLGVAIFGLRLFGQGLMSHTAITSMARYFDRERGTAMSIAGLGFPAGEAVLPIIAVTAIGALDGWRPCWRLSGIVLAVVTVPLTLTLLRGHGMRHREMLERTARGGGGADAGTGASASASADTDAHTRTHADAHPDADAHAPRRQWSRRDLLRDVRFYLLLPAVVAPAFIVTGLFFHQQTLISAKGWSATWFASCFVGFAAAQLPASLIAGPLVDRIGALRLLPFYLVPIAIGLAALASADHAVVALVFLVLTGVTGGMIGPIVGATWAELYGVLHLGAIRALVSAIMVFSTAASPVLMGVLINRGVTVDAIAWMCVGYVVIATGLSVAAFRRPRAER